MGKLFNNKRRKGNNNKSNVATNTKPAVVPVVTGTKYGHSEVVTEKDTIKVTVTEAVFLKMRYLCEVIRDVEWSGILLYSVHGSIHSPGTLELITEDIIPMNKGNQTYTEYNFTEKKRDNSGYEDKHIDYVMENPEAMDWKIGHIHSHNTMNVFFSGTDSTELKDNSVTHDFYLSLIVNNKMEMTARVAVYSEVIQDVETTLQATDELGNSYNRRTINRQVKFSDFETYDCVIDVDRTPVIIDPVFSRSVDDIINKASYKAPTPIYGTTAPGVYKSPTAYPNPLFNDDWDDAPVVKTPNNQNIWREPETESPSKTVYQNPLPEAQFLYADGPGKVAESTNGTIFTFLSDQHSIEYFFKYIITTTLEDHVLDKISIATAIATAYDEMETYEEDDQERCITISEEIFNNMKIVFGIKESESKLQLHKLLELRDLTIKVESLTDSEFVTDLNKVLEYLINKLTK